MALRLEKGGYQAVTETVKRDQWSALLLLDVLLVLPGAAYAASGGGSLAGAVAGGLFWFVGLDYMTGAARTPSVRELRVTLPAAAAPAARSP